MIHKPLIGLALGGGGARGLAHVGVLKVLEREHIRIDIITGSSAGALVGAMYAQHADSHQVETKIRNFINSPDFESIGFDQLEQKEQSENILSQIAENIKERLVINIAFSRTSLVSNKRYLKAISSLVDEGDISKTNIKLGIVASDIVSGESILFEHGDIHTLTLASSSVPGYLPPIEYDDFTLVDGAVLAPLPILEAYRLGADIVIGVNVMPDLNLQATQDNIIDIIMRNSQIMGIKYSQLLSQKADYVLRPDVGQYHWANFKEFDYLIKAGEMICQEKIKEIKAVLRRSYYLKKKFVAFFI
ncbi:patatin-like phospholipase family protein [candidate division KSB1 bacterium]|nr:patatin-like phospholipase family protein [candidate division KSB1 bacterium]